MTGPRTRTPAMSGALADALTGSHGIDTHDIELGDGLNKSIGLGMDQSLEEIRDGLNATISHDINDPHLKKFMADSAFMEEEVLVRVATSSDPTATRIVQTWCNGVLQNFIRGEFVIAKRKFVGVLASANPYSVTTPEYSDAQGNRTTRIDKQAGHLYAFEMQDKNPMGQHWLRRVRQEA